MKLIYSACILTAVLIVTAAQIAPDLPVFTDVTAQAGITFKHSFGDYELTNIVEGTGSGVTFFDYDNDGYLDIYFVNGRWQHNVSDNRGRDLQGKLSNALYRNNGDGTFTDVTDKAGVAGTGYGFSSSAVDFDQDGDLDLYVLNYGPNTFYRNNGDGTFTDITKQTGLGDPLWSLSAPWLDYDNDGDLDVYVANYLEYDDGKFRAYYAAAGYPGPLSYSGQQDHLYRNNGDGTFTDVTAEAGLINPDGRAMSAIAADLNNDGFMDIYVANDAMENYYYENQGNGTFRDNALFTGLAFGQHGQGVSSMGPEIADIDHDGNYDIFIPDMDYGSLFVKKGKLYEDLIDPSNLALICGQFTGWGAIFFDYDNDSWVDLFVSNGNAHHEYPENQVLVRNNGKGQFLDVARHSGEYFQRKYVARGSAAADYDNDGDIDLLVVHLNSTPALLRNDGGNKSNWLKVDVRAPGGKVPCIGARVTVTIGKKKLMDEVIGVRGYLSQSDTRVHFGLGKATQADLVEVRWPERTVQRFRNVRANQTLIIVKDAPVGVSRK
ncbi:MAG TPA: CRTAC1 family protein [Acidobacteriota bacterium]|nr:CRTAC1 family protein [Acidobacteriota bacterium]